jgi:hypothetical protein
MPLEGNPQLVAARFRYWIRKLQAHFLADDYDSAVAAAARVQKLNWRSQSFVEVAEYPFYAALAHAGSYSMPDTDERLRHLNTILDHQSCSVFGRGIVPKILHAWKHWWERKSLEFKEEILTLNGFMKMRSVRRAKIVSSIMRL